MGNGRGLPMQEIFISGDIEPRTYGTFVRTTSGEERVGLLDFLEREGFAYDSTSGREDILESHFPISLNLEEKRICRMGSVVTAAAAASAKRIITVEEFHAMYAG